MIKIACQIQTAFIMLQRLFPQAGAVQRYRIDVGETGVRRLNLVGEFELLPGAFVVAIPDQGKAV